MKIVIRREMRNLFAQIEFATKRLRFIFAGIVKLLRHQEEGRVGARRQVESLRASCSGDAHSNTIQAVYLQNYFITIKKSLKNGFNAGIKSCSSLISYPAFPRPLKSLHKFQNEFARSLLVAFVSEEAEEICRNFNIHDGRRGCR